MLRTSKIPKLLLVSSVVALAAAIVAPCMVCIEPRGCGRSSDSWIFELGVSSQDTVAVYVSVVRHAYGANRYVPDKLAITPVSTGSAQKTAAFEDTIEGDGDFLHYRLESVECQDLDRDGMSEIIAYWESGPMCNWCILSMTVYRYSPDAHTVTPVSVLTSGGELRTSLLGGFRITNIDLDPALEVIRYTPAFGSDDQIGFECMVCPHRYSFAVYEYREAVLTRDREWNGGMSATTELKFYQSTFEDRMLPMYLSSSLYNRSSSSECGPIVISSPEAGEVLVPPIEVCGEAPAEGTGLFLRIMDESGNVLHLDRLSLHDKVEGVGTRFHTTVYPTRPTSATGVLEIIMMDGITAREPLTLATLPVRFDMSFGERCLVYMYKETEAWNESGPHFVAVSRWVPPSKEDAIRALLKGPTEEEAAAGMRGQTCRSAVEIRRLTMEAGHIELALYGTGWDPLRLEWVSEEKPVDVCLLSEQIGRTLCGFPGIAGVTITFLGGAFGGYSDYSYVSASAGL